MNLNVNETAKKEVKPTLENQPVPLTDTWRFRLRTDNHPKKIS